MDLSRLLRQTVQWQVIDSVNDRDDRTYAPAVTVPCRKSMRQNDIIGRNGEVTTSLMEVLMTLQPNIGDTLDGREVIQVQESIDSFGTLVGYLVHTR